MINSLNEAMEQFRLISGKFYNKFEFESEDEVLEFFKDDVNDLISLYYDTMVFVYNNPEIQDDCVEDLDSMLEIIVFVAERILIEMIKAEHFSEKDEDNVYQRLKGLLDSINPVMGYVSGLDIPIFHLGIVFDKIIRDSCYLSFDEGMLLYGKMVNLVSEMADNFETWFWEQKPQPSFNDGVVLEYGKSCVNDGNWNYINYDWDFSYNANNNLPVIVLGEDEPVIETHVVEPDSQKALNPAQLLLTTSFVDLNEDVIISIIPVEVDLLPVEACTELLLGVIVDRGVLGGFVPIV